jgi:hypothetical protein
MPCSAPIWRREAIAAIRLEFYRYPEPVIEPISRRASFAIIIGSSVFLWGLIIGIVVLMVKW